MEMVDIEDELFMTKFDYQDDRNKVVNDGMWLIYDHYIAIMLWIKVFMTG